MRIWVESAKKNDTSLIPEIILVGFQTIQILTIVVSQRNIFEQILSLDLWDPVEPPSEEYEWNLNWTITIMSTPD